MVRRKLPLPETKIAELCRRHHIRRLSLFGSVLRDDFGPSSDVDMLVEFEPDHGAGHIKLAGSERELGALLGRTVDLNTANMLSRYFRDAVLAEAEAVYVAA